MHIENIKHINRKSLVSGAFILFILTVMILILFKSYSISEIQALFLKLKTGWLLAAIGCILFSYLSEMMCFYEITKKIHGKASLRTSFRVTMAGVYFNSVTPFACGGEPFQVNCLMKYGVPMGSCANIIMVKSTVYQASVFLTSIAALIFNAASLNRLVDKFGLFFITGAAINFTVILFFVLFLVNKNAARKAVNFVFKLLAKCRIIKNPEKYSKKKEEGLECFNRASRMIFTDARVIAKVIFYQLLNLSFIYVVPYFLLISLEGKYGYFWDIITSQAVLRQITSYIPSPGASGGTEGISYFFFRNFFTRTPVVSVILIWRILTYYFNIVFSVLYLAFIEARKAKRKTGYLESRKAA